MVEICTVIYTRNLVLSNHHYTDNEHHSWQHICHYSCKFFCHTSISFHSFDHHSWMDIHMNSHRQTTNSMWLHSDRDSIGMLFLFHNFVQHSQMSNCTHSFDFLLSKRHCSCKSHHRKPVEFHNDYQCNHSCRYKRSYPNSMHNKSLHSNISIWYRYWIVHSLNPSILRCT